jgi:hypothetical protein
MRPVADGEVFGLALVVHPLLEKLLAEDAALGEEGVVTLQGGQGFVEGGRQGLDAGALLVASCENFR